MIKSKFTLVVAVVAVSLCAVDASDAFAKAGRGRKRNVDTVRMAPPANGAGTVGRGNITITHTPRGDDAVLHVKGLDKRTTYDVVNGQTGDLLGTLRTNRKGQGTFDLTPRLGKRVAAADGTTGENTTDVPQVVDVVDPDTGDPVLTGDTTGDLQALYGYATMGNATESATVTMGSDPISDSQYFSFSYFAEPSADGWSAGVYELYTDTLNGDELPLGKSSVLDLAGLRFQVRDANGDIAFKGTLPDVEAYAIDDPALPEPGDPVVLPDGSTYVDPNLDWNWVDPSADAPKPGDTGGMPFDFASWFQDGDPFATFMMSGFFGGGHGGGGKWFKTGRVDPTNVDPTNADPTTGDTPPVDVPTVEFTLWIETADGFAKAGDLLAPDWGFDDGWDDWGGCDGGDWGGDWNWDVTIDDGQGWDMGFDPSTMMGGDWSMMGGTTQTNTARRGGRGRRM